MIAKKRLAKRSIIGTRIAAPGHDGRFYPGVIEATKTGLILRSTELGLEIMVGSE